MSSFHPLGSAADSHPLTAAPADLPFHDDDDNDDAWTPPSLPGETRVLPTSGTGRARRTNGVGGGSSSSRSPLDPLHSGSGDRSSFANGYDDDGAAAEEESYGHAVNKYNDSSGSSGGITRTPGVPGGGRRDRERGRPATAGVGGPIGKAAVGAGR